MRGLEVFKGRGGVASELNVGAWAGHLGFAATAYLAVFCGQRNTPGGLQGGGRQDESEISGKKGQRVHAERPVATLGAWRPGPRCSEQG